MPSRRRRCDQCHQLVGFTYDWWPKGVGIAPRHQVCELCYDGVVMFTEVAMRKVIS